MTISTIVNTDRAKGKSTVHPSLNRFIVNRSQNNSWKIDIAGTEYVPARCQGLENNWKYRHRIERRIKNKMQDFVPKQRSDEHL